MGTFGRSIRRRRRPSRIGRRRRPPRRSSRRAAPRRRSRRPDRKGGDDLPVAAERLVESTVGGPDDTAEGNGEQPRPHEDQGPVPSAVRSDPLPPTDAHPGSGAHGRRTGRCVIPRCLHRHRPRLRVECNEKRQLACRTTSPLFSGRKTSDLARSLQDHGLEHLRRL